MVSLQNNITLAGESAGAVYTHAHLVTGTPVKRAVLASGSLYLSSPLPVEKGQGLIKALEAKVQELGEPSLRLSSVPALLQALKECNVNTMWIQEDEDFQGWEGRSELVDELMIGDTEYEVGAPLSQPLKAFTYPRAVGHLEERNRDIRWRSHYCCF